MSQVVTELVDECIRSLLVPAMRRAHIYEAIEASRNGGWFDARGWCPICGYSLAFDQAESLRPHRWRHASCGGRDRHAWLIGRRRMRLLST